MAFAGTRDQSNCLIPTRLLLDAAQRNFLQIGRNFAPGHHAAPQPGDTIAGPVTIADYDKRKAVSLGVALFDSLASISAERHHPIQALTTGWFKEQMRADVNSTRAFHREAEHVSGELGIPYADINPIMQNQVDMEGCATERYPACACEFAS